MEIQWFQSIKVRFTLFSVEILDQKPQSFAGFNNERTGVVQLLRRFYGL